jgi:hypothetical protein
MPKAPSTVGTPKILIIFHAVTSLYGDELRGTFNPHNNPNAVTSFYGANQPGTPKLRFYPTSANTFIVPKEGDTKIYCYLGAANQLVMP